MLFKKFFVGIISLLLLINVNNSVANAEIKIVEAEGEYTADIRIKETLDEIREHAFEDARRNAIERAGVVIQSYSESINFKLTQDRIETIAGGIIRTFDRQDIPSIDSEGNYKVVCKIKAEVDTDKIDPEKILANELQYQNIREKDKRIRELEEEKLKLIAQNEKATSELERQRIQNEVNRNQQQFLITKYERDLNIYDFDNVIDWDKTFDVAQKLIELDPLNATAFRATIYYYREQGDLKVSVDYCNRILKSNPPADTAIEAYTQLGDIYYNEFNDKDNARKNINAGIALVKKTYSKAMIEKFVNGTNFQIVDLHPVGKTNTIRELYILKSDIENVNPKFSSGTTLENWKLTEDRIYDIKYRTDW